MILNKPAYVEENYNISIEVLKGYSISFECRLNRVDVWKFGKYGYFNVFFKNKNRALIRIPLEIRFNCEELLLNKIKENRTLKGILTREFNKAIALKRSLK